MQTEGGGDDRRLASAQRRCGDSTQHMRSCRPTRVPTSKPVLIVATKANVIGRAGRRLRPEEKPVRAGPSPAGSEQQRHGGRRERGRRWATPAAVRRGPGHMTHHDELLPARTGPWFVQPGEKACHESPTARVSPPATAAASTASASRLAERGRRSARSRCPTSSRSALARVQQTSAPPSAGNQGSEPIGRGGPTTDGAGRSRN